MAKTDGPRKAVFFDRDGVLNYAEVRNGRPYAPLNIKDFRVIPQAVKAVNCLKKVGYLIIVVTNQRDVGRGLMSQKTLDSMHEMLTKRMPIDDIFACTCIADCECYKPRPGMLLEAAAKWDLNLKGSIMVGDRWRDVGAGEAAGCKTVFIDLGYDEELRNRPTKSVKSVEEAVNWIMSVT